MQWPPCLPVYNNVRRRNFIEGINIVKVIRDGFFSPRLGSPLPCPLFHCLKCLQRTQSSSQNFGKSKHTSIDPAYGLYLHVQRVDRVCCLRSHQCVNIPSKLTTTSHAPCISYGRIRARFTLQIWVRSIMAAQMDGCYVALRSKPIHHAGLCHYPAVTTYRTGMQTQIANLPLSSDWLLVLHSCKQLFLVLKGTSLQWQTMTVFL